MKSSVMGFVYNRSSALAMSLALALIRFYQLVFSPHLPRSCRYAPSCSAYAYEAICKHGPFRGVFMAVRRLLRCHPFNPGGYDPVP